MVIGARFVSSSHLFSPASQPILLEHLYRTLEDFPDVAEEIEKRVVAQQEKYVAKMDKARDEIQKKRTQARERKVNDEKSKSPALGSHGRRRASVVRAQRKSLSSDDTGILQKLKNTQTVKRTRSARAMWDTGFNEVSGPPSASELPELTSGRQVEMKHGKEGLVERNPTILKKQQQERRLMRANSTCINNEIDAPTGRDSSLEPAEKADGFKDNGGNSHSDEFSTENIEDEAGKRQGDSGSIPRGSLLNSAKLDDIRNAAAELEEERQKSKKDPFKMGLDARMVSRRQKR